MNLNRNSLERMITEEISKSEVNSMIANKIDAKIGSAEFKKVVKGLASDVVNELFKILWQRNSFWKSATVNA